MTLLGLCALLSLGQAARTLEPDPPVVCGLCEEWNASQEPFRVFGNTFYVGVAGLSAILITSDDGHILLDGGLPQSAPLIDQNIRALGLRTTDVRLILNSHAHFDHAGGMAALQRASGAVVVASAAGARVIQRGEPFDDDPQFGFGAESMRFPRVPDVRAVEDGEEVRLGTLTVTAHLTPGHTPGSTTWTWRSCEASRCLDVVYADSLNPVSAPGFRFSGEGDRPGVVDAFARSIATVAQLPCDILLTVHPGFMSMNRKLAARTSGVGTDPFIDPTACRAYAENAARTLAERVAEEGRSTGVSSR